MNENTIKKWDDLNLKTNLLRGIYSYGFEYPSDIQKRAIFPIINGKDVIAQAQSGTGKTGTFSIASLQLLDETLNSTQVLVLTTTRELATQTYKVFTDIGTFMEGLNTKLLVGGTSVNEDIKYLSNTNPHIIIGTPGRVFDMIKRKKINLYTVKLFIMDEADEMLSSGFRDQIKTIFEYFNDSIQNTIFSATMPREIIQLTQKFMNEPLRLTMKTTELSLNGIEQYFVAAQDDLHKYELLKAIYNKLNQCSSIIFVNGIKRVNSLHEAMEKDGFLVHKMHSLLDKEQRAEVLSNFKNTSNSILISSDLTARGIDIQQISLVINFDIPKDVHTYLHRIGRSGRWGRKGTAINIICERDVYTMKKIESHYKIDIKEYQ